MNNSVNYTTHYPPLSVYAYVPYMCIHIFMATQMYSAPCVLSVATWLSLEWLVLWFSGLCFCREEWHTRVSSPKECANTCAPTTRPDSERVRTRININFMRITAFCARRVLLLSVSVSGGIPNVLQLCCMCMYEPLPYEMANIFARRFHVSE